MATTTHKAWASAAMTLALALAARFTGMVDMPASDAVTDAFMTAGGALLAAGASYFVTWAIPNKDKGV